uniref:Uncharacterized protein n=1 Tax=Cannabis sativa TaxID=3483 RepID=A0A803NPU8_CANSA
MERHRSRKSLIEMVATHSTSVDRKTPTTGGMPVDGAALGTTLAPRAPKTGLGTSSSTRLPRPPLVASKIGTND